MNTDELFIEINNLPKPLVKKELYELIDEMNQGNITAREKLIKHNIRLVLYEVINKFKNADYDKKDLVSIGNIGLIKSVNTFDISKNVEFSTYAIRCIDNEILMYLNKIKKHQNIDSLDKTVSSYNDGDEIKIQDIICDDTDFTEEYTNKETYHIIRKLINDLPPYDREIIMLYFGFYDNKTYTQYEIANKLSLSQSHVSRLIKKIVKSLGHKLEKEDVIELRNRTIKEEFSNTKEKVLKLY